MFHHFARGTGTTAKVAVPGNDNRPRLASWSRICGSIQLDAMRLTSLALPVATAQRMCVVQKSALAKTLRERLSRVSSLRQDGVGDALQCGCQHERVERHGAMHTLSARRALPARAAARSLTGPHTRREAMVGLRLSESRHASTSLRDAMIVSRCVSARPKNIAFARAILQK